MYCVEDGNLPEGLEYGGQKKPHEITTTYVRMKCVVGRAWIGIPAPVAPRSCSTNLEYKSLDSMRVYKRVAYSRFLLG
jgi:hypothetical protein